MIRSCDSAIYYRLIIYSNIKDVLFDVRQWRAWNDDVGIWVKKSFGDKLKDSATGGKTILRAARNVYSLKRNFNLFSYRFLPNL